MTKHLLPAPRSTPLFSASRVQAALGTWTRFAGWSVLLIVLVINIASRVPITLPKEVTMFMSMLYPHQKESHISVLGASTQSPEKEERNNLEVEYAYWQSVVAQYPQYRDGYLMLARI